MPGHIKAFIVAQNACFNTPTQVTVIVKERYGITLSPQNIENYDPTKMAGKTMEAEDIEEFYRVREQYRADCAKHAIGNRAWRIEQYQLRYDAIGKNHAMALNILEQAAKEMGDIFTNRQKVEHSVDETLEKLLDRIST